MAGRKESGKNDRGEEKGVGGAEINGENRAWEEKILYGIKSLAKSYQRCN